MPDVGPTWPAWYHDRACMSHVHADTVTARHDELDAFGTVRMSACLRWMAQAAANASTAIGYGPEWYEARGLMWLVRRTTLDLERPIGRGECLTLRTFVEDFRRVRSHRAYVLEDGNARVVGSGRTDWVMIATASGRPVRVPREVEAAFGSMTERTPADRSAWTKPPPPDATARMSHVVRFADLDSLAHVNNATYVDLLVEGALGHFTEVGWHPDRCRAADRLPWMHHVDIEYLDAAVWGDALDSVTWTSDAGPALRVHQRLVRRGDEHALVRAETLWKWRRSDGQITPPPVDVGPPLRSGSEDSRGD